MKKLTLRRVEKTDCALLFRWANDRMSREQSFHMEEIPMEEHIAWFRRKLADESCRMFLLLYYGKEAGQIRLDLEGDTAWISYAIAPEYRGRGLGAEILRLVEPFAPVPLLAGRVKRGNIASARCFEKNGYERAEREKWVEYRKKVQYAVPDIIWRQKGISDAEI